MTREKAAYWKRMANAAYDTGLTDRISDEEYAIIECLAAYELPRRTASDIGRLRKDLMDLEDYETDLDGLEDDLTELLEEKVEDEGWNTDWDSESQRKSWEDAVWSGTSRW